MDAIGGAAAGLVAAVALGAFRLVEMAISKRQVRAGNGTLSENARVAADYARRNHDILDKTDDDGARRVYQPKWVGALLRRHHELSREQAETSKRQTAILEKLERSLQGHMDREEKKLGEIKDVLRDFQR